MTRTLRLSIPSRFDFVLENDRPQTDVTTPIQLETRSLSVWVNGILVPGDMYSADENRPVVTFFHLLLSGDTITVVGSPTASPL
jgi:hypothetical protein